MPVGLAVASIVAVYLATRLWFVGRFPYFVDETLYATWTAQGAQSIHQLFVSLTISQGPLQPWLAIVWVKLGFSPLIAVRLVSVASGILTVGVVGLLGRRVGGTAVGWVAAALGVVLPFFVVNDGVGIYEPLVTLIVVSALYLQLELARRPALRVGFVLGLVFGAGILTKENTLPALVLLPVSLVCFDWSPEGRRWRLRLWLGAVAIAALGVLIAELLLRSSSYWSRAQEFSRLFPLSRSLGQVLSHPFATQAWPVFRPVLIGYVTAPLLAVAGLGVLLLWRNQRALTALLVIWITVPFAAALMFITVAYPRHVMYLMPPIIVLMAYALVQAATWARRELKGPIAAIGCSAVGVLVLVPALRFDGHVLANPGTASYPGLDYWQYVAGWPSGLPYQGAAKLIRQRGTGRRVVIVIPAGDGGILKLMFWHDRRYTFVDGPSPLASQAQFVLTGGNTFSSLATVLGDDPQGVQAQRQFALTHAFTRPKGPCSGPGETGCGETLNVFERLTRPQP